MQPDVTSLQAGLRRERLYREVAVGDTLSAWRRGEELSNRCTDRCLRPA